MDNTKDEVVSDVEDMDPSVPQELRPLTLLSRLATRNLKRPHESSINNTYQWPNPNLNTTSAPALSMWPTANTYTVNDSVRDRHSLLSAAQNYMGSLPSPSSSFSLHRTNEPFYPHLVHPTLTSATTSTPISSGSQSPVSIYDPIICETPPGYLGNGGRTFPGRSTAADTKEQPDGGIAVTNNKRMRRLLPTKDEKGRKSYRCPKAFCSKVYKNSNGLKYHLDHGQCEAEDSDAESDMPEKVKRAVRPYTCSACDKRYKNLNGLKYHAKVSNHEISMDSKRSHSRGRRPLLVGQNPP
ncbi:hypothetical protein SeMB42_g02119 [Synchytrium endobioticum]|uniref:C2H2-type domain-containing protein n=1 Tax=Synchytrium endobioticum TaxID=286115 RepID=A0A507DHU6_9FUNG|nr:hypothetical protein SeMB42_g02119 [Synchytrium endobioticum]